MNHTIINEFETIIEKGLLLLGWQNFVRLTSEDKAMVHSICQEALELEKDNSLTIEKIDELSQLAYEIISFQIINTQERADYISLVYINSSHFKSLINLIDEATLCFYKGYFTAALSLSFITLEKYLRSVFNWSPEDNDPTFLNLKQSVLSLPNQTEAQNAHKIINVIYSRYEALCPNQFDFNRHGLLHGIRGATKYDEMNCARIFQLFNLLCNAENVDRTGYGKALEFFNTRYGIFTDCKRNIPENKLLKVIWNK